MRIKYLMLLMCMPALMIAAHKVKITDYECGKPATVKVLLENDINGMLLEARGPFVVYNPANEKKVSASRRSKRFYLHPHDEGIKWGENFLGIFQLQFVPSSGDTTFLVNGIEYRGAIEVYNINNQLKVINDIDVESFIKGVLNQRLKDFECDSNVMEALAIINRTDTYYKALINHDVFWHLDARKIGYNGTGFMLQNPCVDKAVDDTRYLVMTFEDQPFPATWAQHSGGKTASYGSIFRSQTLTPDGVEIPIADRNIQDVKWSFNMHAQELGEVIQVNCVTGVDLFVDDFSGGVHSVRFYDGSHEKNVDFITLQRFLGAEHLQSNHFSIKVKGDEVFFQGYGKGVNVGLCMYSAAVMGKSGDDAPTILSRFFPGIILEKMRSYPETVVSNHKRSFITLKKKHASKRAHKLLR